jgi:hypothetical protein
MIPGTHAMKLGCTSGSGLIDATATRSMKSAHPAVKHAPLSIERKAKVLVADIVKAPTLRGTGQKL